MRIRIRALGAAGEVGRSAILIEDDYRRVLLDCGLKFVHENGSKDYAVPVGLEEIAPKLDAVILSHAHLDHTGYAPALYRMGYKGKIYATPPTKDVTEILREDTLKLSKGRLRTSAEMYAALRNFEVYGYGDEFEVVEGVTVKFYDAGHSLGSAQVLIDREGTRILYTGDVKPEPTEYFDGAARPGSVDVVISEATNGSEEIPDRSEVKSGLADAVEDTFSRGGTVLIPAFAYGRSQEVVAALLERGIDVPIYMDGMSVRINDVFRKYRTRPRVSDATLARYPRPPMDRNNVIETKRARGGGLNPEMVRYLIVSRPVDKVVVSTSGMLEGGPILTYLKLVSADSRSLLAFSGYQVRGTLGREVLDGAREIVVTNEQGLAMKINLRMRVDYFRLSGHASREALIEYLESLNASRIFFVHGEEASIEYLKEAVGGEMLELNKTVELRDPARRFLSGSSSIFTSSLNAMRYTPRGIPETTALDSSNSVSIPSSI